jgi:hypothetical protein
MSHLSGAGRDHVRGCPVVRHGYSRPRGLFLACGVTMGLTGRRIRPELIVEARADRLRTAHVIGPYNSGTNFLAAMLDKNGIPHTDDGESPLRQAAFKHYPYPVAARAMAATGASADGVLFVVLLRNPFNWIDALKRSPYEFVYRDLVSSCHIDVDLALNHHQPYREHLEGVMNESELIAAFTFDNLVSYWSTFYRGYAEASMRGELDVLLLRYEDLVAAPAECLQAIRAAMGLEPATELVLPLGSAKSHGVSAGYIEARRKLGQPPALGWREATQIRSRLDREVMAMAGYRGLDAPLRWLLGGASRQPADA